VLRTPIDNQHRHWFRYLPVLTLGLTTGCMGVVVPDPLATEGSSLPPHTPGPEVIVETPQAGPIGIEPGRVVAHRLNRLEYNNTLRDLFFGLDLRPADAFPVDTFAEGFDNNAQELRMSNLLLEKYFEAADRVVPLVFANSILRGKLVPCDLADASCVRVVLSTFGERAFRRPVAEADLAPYLGLVDLARKQGDSVDVGVQLAIKAMLVSPLFLYRIEPDPPQDTTRVLDGFEVATRLSYFLWSSMPDDELFARARSGALRQADVVSEQVQRMLADRKAGELVDNLAGQWLYTRQIGELNPDPQMFPADAFDSSLREAMRQEMHLYLREVLLGEHSALELLRSDFTFANRRLAEHYGLPGARSLTDELKRVEVEGDQRGGLFTQGGWLTVTSHPDTTSPTKRGKWIVSELLCQAPPPPPPGADNLPPAAPGTGTSFRERLQQHASVEPCRTCHLLFDPLGLALEHFDPIGRWRDADGETPIETSGTVPGSDARFDGHDSLAEALQKDPRFARCLTRKLMTFAMGRGLETSDTPALDLLSKRFAEGGYKFRELVEAIATSPLMTSRGGRSEP
jgi:hypothetical protein